MTLDVTNELEKNRLAIEYNMERSIVDLKEKAAKRIGQLQKFAEQLSKLVELELLGEEDARKLASGGYLWKNLYVSPDKFPALHAAFGQCKLNMGSKSIHSAERAEVKFALDLGDEYIGPCMYTVRQLSPEDKCKIVTTVETNTLTQLLCSNE